MSFSLVSGQHIQHQTGVLVSVALNATATLPNNPTTGNLVIVGVSWFGSTAAPPSISVTDGSGNTYTKSANSPSNSLGTTAGAEYIYYLLSAPSNANKVITAALGTDTSAGAVADVWVMEFASSLGSVTFDSDLAGTGGPASTITTPNVTPIHANALLFGIGGTDNGAVNAMTSPWICPETVPNTYGDGAAYILSRSVATAANWPLSASSSWDAIIAAFYENVAGAGPVPYQPTYFTAPAQGY